MLDFGVEIFFIGLGFVTQYHRSILVRRTSVFLYNPFIHYLGYDDDNRTRLIFFSCLYKCNGIRFLVSDIKQKIDVF